MRRRDFVVLAGSVALLPHAVRAQMRSEVPVIGFLSTGAPGPFVPFVAALKKGLAEAGYIEGQNVAIEYRWAEGHYERLPALAAELRARKVDVIVASGGVVSARAAQAATSTIPIVVITSGDPVRAGLVASISRPGGNLTGISFIAAGLGAKRLELLRDLALKSAVVGVLVNPDNITSTTEGRDTEATAATIGFRTIAIEARRVEDFEPGFAKLAAGGASALLVTADPFYTGQRETLAELAARHAIPAIYANREFVGVGGLMSYGTSLTDAYRQAGGYVARILKGDKPADLPVLQETKFELIVNLKTAKTIGLEIPASILYRADEVIE